MTLGTDDTRPLRPAIVSVVKLASVLLALVSTVALLFSIVTLVRAGPSAIAETGVGSLGATWPTAAALALILFGPAIWSRLGAAPTAGLTLLGAWLISAGWYLSFGGAAWGLRSMLATLIWTVAPLVPAFTLRAIVALKRSTRPSTQMLICGAIGLVLWWLASPTAITITCAVAGSCP